MTSLEGLAVSQAQLLQQVHGEVREIKGMLTMITSKIQSLDVYAQNVDSRISQVKLDVASNMAQAGRGLNDRIAALERIAEEARAPPHQQYAQPPQQHPETQGPPSHQQYAPPRQQYPEPPPQHRGPDGVPPERFHYGSSGALGFNSQAPDPQGNNNGSLFQHREPPRVNSAFRDEHQPFQHTFNPQHQAVQGSNARA